MMKCNDCEYCERGPDGHVVFHCDPLGNIKEPECLAKWQILRLAEVSAKLDKIVAAHETQAAMYRRLAPLQEKMFRYMEKEIESHDESERWKTDEWDDDSDSEEDDPLR